MEQENCRRPEENTGIILRSLLEVLFPRQEAKGMELRGEVDHDSMGESIDYVHYLTAERPPSWPGFSSIALRFDAQYVVLRVKRTNTNVLTEVDGHEALLLAGGSELERRDSLHRYWRKTLSGLLPLEEPLPTVSELLRANEPTRLVWRDCSNGTSKRKSLTELVEEGRRWSETGSAPVSRRTLARRRRLLELVSLPESKGLTSQKKILQRFSKSRFPKGEVESKNS